MEQTGNGRVNTHLVLMILRSIIQYFCFMYQEIMEKHRKKAAEAAATKKREEIEAARKLLEGLQEDL